MTEPLVKPGIGLAMGFWVMDESSKIVDKLSVVIYRCIAGDASRNRLLNVVSHYHSILDELGMNTYDIRGKSCLANHKTSS